MIFSSRNSTNLSQHNVNPHTSPKIKLCLFDLDQTLLRTDQLAEIRGKEYINITGKFYTNVLKEKFREIYDPYIYTKKQLKKLHQQFPDMQWGVFTRANRHYAQTILEQAYPKFTWNCLIAFEDVKRTKPAGYGIKTAMKTCALTNPGQVLLIGDSSHDIQAGYHGQCWTVLDKTSWDQPYSKKHNPAKNLIPDAIIDSDFTLESLLEDPTATLPELEYLLSNGQDHRAKHRFDRIDHFAPDDKTRIMVTVLGRYFTGTPYDHPLGEKHALTQQIRKHKEDTNFPPEWIEAIRSYLSQACKGHDPIVTVIPAKHGRTPRLEALLGRVKISDQKNPIRPDTQYAFLPNLLEFSQDAKSFHKSSVGRYQRYQQADANLTLSGLHNVEHRRVIVLDDVVTTGASFFAARARLKDAGAERVSCMALAKTISRIKQ